MAIILITNPTQSQIIYAIGWDYPVATLWINEERIALSDSWYSTVGGICILEEEVIVLYNEETVSSLSPYYDLAYSLKLWKNGIIEDITDGSQYDYGTSLFIHHNDIYVAGRTRRSDSTLSQGWGDAVVIWKNGEMQYWTPFSEYWIWIRSMFVDDSNIYVTGHKQNSDLVRIARMWINGEETSLTNGPYESEAHSIYVANGNIYVAGFEKNQLGTKTAKLWINGVAHDLSTGEYEAYATSVLIDGDDVYVTGAELTPQTAALLPVLWKNGTRQFLHTSYGEANCIFLYEDDIYIGGSIDYNNSTPIIWKNGEIHQILEQVNNRMGAVYGIVVLPDTTTNIPHVTKNISTISVYPNPTTHYVTVDLPSDISTAEFALFDIYGRLLFTEIIQSKTKINLPDLASGEYVYEVRSGKGEYSGKLLINR